MIITRNIDYPAAAPYPDIRLIAQALQIKRHQELRCGHIGMTQQQVAEKMATSQSYIAKMEGGMISPSRNALKRYAEAKGSQLRIVMEPASHL